MFANKDKLIKNINQKYKKGYVVSFIKSKGNVGVKVIDLAKAIAPKAKISYIGIRPGEKLHEVLISEDEARTVIELDDMYVVQPAEAFWFGREWENKGKEIKDDFRYVSNTNDQWLDVQDIEDFIAPLEKI